MVVLITCKNQEDPVKSEGAREATTLCIHFFRRSRATNSMVGGGMWPKVKPIQAFTIVLIICKNEEDLLKNEGAGVVTTVLPL